MSDSHLDLPIDESTDECFECWETLEVGDLYTIRGERYCLDCAAPVAMGVLQGGISRCSEEEIVGYLTLIEEWVREMERSLLDPGAVQMRAALRHLTKRLVP